MSRPVVETTVDCAKCGAPEAAEPETDGTFQYFECGECGSTFGFTEIGQRQEVCIAGLPIELVTKYSQPPGLVTIKSGDQSQSVWLGSIGEKPQ
jgi:hypothetical protein